jgi:hypothetical protein
MTQKEIDLVYELTISIYQDKWFKEKKRTRDEVQDWVRKQLASFEIYTMPCGMSWGVLCSEELYNEIGNI